MTHVRTSPFYPPSNGKIERWHKSLKSECIRPGTPLSLADGWHLVAGYVGHYNNVRLNSATGYITPRTCGRVGSRRSTRNATASWKRPDSNGRVAASQPRKEAESLRCSIAEEVDCFRIADHPEDEGYAVAPPRFEGDVADSACQPDPRIETPLQLMSAQAKRRPESRPCCPNSCSLAGCIKAEGHPKFPPPRNRPLRVSRFYMTSR
jgi:Integrase core domain